MTIAGSGLYSQAWRKSHSGLIVLDLTLATHKAALFLSTLAVDLDNDAGFASAPFTANQVTGTGYTAGGVTVTGTSYTISPARFLKWTSAVINFGAVTIAAPGARGVVFYANALGTKDAFYLADLGQSFPANGNFQLTPPSGGIFFTDMT